MSVKYDKGKPMFRLNPPRALLELAKVLTFGAIKYTPNGWKDVPDARNRYLDALYRHLNAWQQGETYDEESGLSHLSHAFTNLAFLVEFEQEDLDKIKAKQILNMIRDKVEIKNPLDKIEFNE